MRKQTIGFIGLGSLGEGLCNSLVTAGYQVTVNDLNKDLAKRLLAGGALRRKRTPRLVARAAALPL